VIPAKFRSTTNTEHGRSLWSTIARLDVVGLCVAQDYMVSMYLRQAWRDGRLAYEPFRNKIKKFRLGDDSWNRIWTPDTFLRNEKGADFHDVTVENRMLTLTYEGDLWYVTK